jgi:hypothetical protein
LKPHYYNHYKKLEIRNYHYQEFSSSWRSRS